MSEEIVVNIDPTGKLSIDVQGGKGKSCEELTRFLTESLGKEDNKEYKPEYRQQLNVHGSSQVRTKE